jgi:pimeloyl-ACP methyl ester carboxylesterase
MTDLSAEEMQVQVEQVVATFGGRPPRRHTRLARELDGAEQHAVPMRSGSVAAWRVGEGPATLLAHGFADSHALWSPLMAALIQAGRPFVAMDLPGHGRSEESSHSILDGVSAIQAVAQALGPIDSVVGHSMSAATVIYALAEGLPASRAVLIATAPQYQREFVRLEGRVPPHTPPEVIARAREVLIETTPVAPQFDVAAAASRLLIPALLIHARDDERWSPDATAFIARHWRGSETYYADGLGHRGVARDPDVVRRTVAFLHGPPEASAAAG